jgi:hypothetical protein
MWMHAGERGIHLYHASLVQDFVYINFYPSGAGGHNKIASKLRGNPICATSLITREEGAVAAGEYVGWVGPSAALHAAYIARHVNVYTCVVSFDTLTRRERRGPQFLKSVTRKKITLFHIVAKQRSLTRADRLRKMRFAENDARQRRRAHKFIQMRPFLIDGSAYALCAPSRGDKTTIYGYVFLKSPPVVLMIAS